MIVLGVSRVRVPNIHRSKNDRPRHCGSIIVLFDVFRGLILTILSLAVCFAAQLGCSVDLSPGSVLHLNLSGDTLLPSITTTAQYHHAFEYC